MLGKPLTKFFNGIGLIAFGFELRDEIKPPPAFRFFRTIRAVWYPNRRRFFHAQVCRILHEFKVECGHKIARRSHSMLSLFLSKIVRGLC